MILTLHQYLRRALYASMCTLTAWTTTVASATLIASQLLYSEARAKDVSFTGSTNPDSPSTLAWNTYSGQFDGDANYASGDNVTISGYVNATYPSMIDFRAGVLTLNDDTHLDLTQNAGNAANLGSLVMGANTEFLVDSNGYFYFIDKIQGTSTDGVSSSKITIESSTAISEGAISGIKSIDLVEYLYAFSSFTFTDNAIREEGLGVEKLNSYGNSYFRFAFSYSEKSQYDWTATSADISSGYGSLRFNDLTESTVNFGALFIDSHESDTSASIELSNVKGSTISFTSLSGERDLVLGGADIGFTFDIADMNHYIINSLSDYHGEISLSKKESMSSGESFEVSSLTFKGAMTQSANKMMTIGEYENVFIDAVTMSGEGGLSFGALTLKNANSLNSGTLSVGKLNFFDNNASLKATGGKLQLSAASYGENANEQSLSLGVAELDFSTGTGSTVNYAIELGAHTDTAGTQQSPVMTTLNVGEQEITIAGNITDGIDSVAGLIIKGTGSLILSGVNKYAGETSLEAGVSVQLSDKSALGSRVVNFGASSKMTVTTWGGNMTLTSAAGEGKVDIGADALGDGFNNATFSNMEIGFSGGNATSMTSTQLVNTDITLTDTEVWTLTNVVQGIGSKIAIDSSIGSLVLSNHTVQVASDQGLLVGTASAYADIVFSIRTLDDEANGAAVVLRDSLTLDVVLTASDASDFLTLMDETGGAVGFDLFTLAWADVTLSSSDVTLNVYQDALDADGLLWSGTASGSFSTGNGRVFMAEFEAVPEPSTVSLSLLALSALLARRRRKLV